MICNQFLNDYEKEWIGYLQRHLFCNPRMSDSFKNTNLRREITDYYWITKFSPNNQFNCENIKCKKVIELRGYRDHAVPVQILFHFEDDAISEIEAFCADSSKIEEKTFESIKKWAIVEDE